MNPFEELVSALLAIYHIMANRRITDLNGTTPVPEPGSGSLVDPHVNRAIWAIRRIRGLASSKWALYKDLAVDKYLEEAEGWAMKAWLTDPEAFHRDITAYQARLDSKAYLNDQGPLIKDLYRLSDHFFPKEKIQEPSAEEVAKPAKEEPQATKEKVEPPTRLTANGWECPRKTIIVAERLKDPLLAYLEGLSECPVEDTNAYRLKSDLKKLIQQGRKAGFNPPKDRWPRGVNRKGVANRIVFDAPEDGNPRNQ